MRLWPIISKELKCVKEDVSFNLATLISPLLFLLAFSLMLQAGILLPVEVYPAPSESRFLSQMADYRAPDQTAYFALHPSDDKLPPTNAQSDLIVVEQEPALEGELITGSIIHYLNDVNQNTTKNFRNRLDGALVEYIGAMRAGGNVVVHETTVYEQDVPWATGFGVSVLVFGLMLSGLIFGMLSITSEWGDGTAVFLKLSPTSPRVALLGKILANLIKCFVSGLLFIAVFFALSQALPAHLPTLVLTMLLVYGIFICLGMCLGLYIHSALTAFLLSLVSALVLWVSGGGFGPLSYYGGLANAVGQLNPATYAIELMRWCYFTGQADQAAGFMALITALVLSLLLIASLYTKWTRAQEVKS